MLNTKILEEIRILNDKYRILSSFLLALFSGFGAIAFAFSQNKLIINFVIIVLIIIGLIAMNFIAYKMNKIEKERKYLIDKLKEKRWKK
jgi:hypothetical protein